MSKYLEFLSFPRHRKYESKGVLGFLIWHAPFRGFQKSIRRIFNRNHKKQAYNNQHLLQYDHALSPSLPPRTTIPPTSPSALLTTKQPDHSSNTYNPHQDLSRPPSKNPTSSQIIHLRTRSQSPDSQHRYITWLPLPRAKRARARFSLVRAFSSEF